MKTKLITLAFMAALISTACTNRSSGNAANNNQAVLSPATTEAATDKDRDFVLKAASGGMMEVELGNVAQQNAQDKRVKNFGEMMVRDHTKANNELKSVAADKNINIPAGMEDHHHSMVENLRKKSGADFDEAYMDMMVNDHNKDIAEFRTEANQGGDAEIKAFAAKTLPVLQTHLDSAQAIHQEIRNKGTR
jgi:putative membrane protein